MIGRIARILRKPPRYIVERAVQELHGQVERFAAPRRSRWLTKERLLRAAGRPNIGAWWQSLADRPFLTVTTMDAAALDALCPGDSARLLQEADRALARRVDLLGSGPIELGADVDWHRDYKSGVRWQPAYCRDIKYNDLDRPSDVKFPWEVSRMQWMVPLGQAYALTGDERYAAAARDLIDSWIAENPYACSVNWACTMDVALRLISWCWFFQIFCRSEAWDDDGFRGRFLQSLYLHADFTARHLEKSDVNGNHYTADAAGLVFAGLFFGPDGQAAAWLELGWSILRSEIALQVFPDGVDFEASVPYHRLVQELFLYPALYRLRCGLPVDDQYRDRLLAMARFTAAYSRPDGSVPLWGDADDARTLPFRMHPINDHRYLLAIAGLGLDDSALADAFSGSRSEAAWMFGPAVAGQLADRNEAPAAASAAFAEGGFYVLRNASDHVFVDCGPLGLAGRGGHGHNDLLSFEAVVDGVHLVSDCGAYLYTADYRERNRFRSTAYHNTPQVDREEINRFIRPDYLWFLHDDARFGVEHLEFGSDCDRLDLMHTGYGRLPSPVTVRRSFVLDHRDHSLSIADRFDGSGEHRIDAPLHLALGVDCELQGDAAVCTAGERRFVISWQQPEAWSVELERARISPSYGTVVPCWRLNWTRSGKLEPLDVTIRPA
jgi:uncharacterized heparinase superfamily protein